ncbi:MAG TPA: type II secretion system protein GspC [Steroidobacteraceae bacterium]|nr:type II secretion system protein GspC [Steroidobacteraceae bacterium]
MNASSLLGSIREINPESLLNHLAPRLPQIVTWLLAIAIGIQAALIVRDLLPQSAPAGAAAGAVISAPAPANAAQAVDAQQIVNAHLFGVAAPEEANTDPADAPETRMSLVLAGTIASSDPKGGLGIIGETAANAKVYKVGDSIPGGARLNAVYDDRVILERGGQLEALLLPREYRGAGTGTTPAAAPPAARATGAGNEVADRVRRLIAQDPGSVAEIMRPQPVFANGQQRGYRVYPGRNRQQFTRLGLRPGDLVMSINGTPLDDPQRGMEIFRSIGSADQVRVTVERNGKPQELTLNMAQIANELPAEQPAAEGATPMDQAPPMPPDPNNDE